MLALFSLFAPSGYCFPHRESPNACWSVSQAPSTTPSQKLKWAPMPSGTELFENEGSLFIIAGVSSYF